VPACSLTDAYRRVSNGLRVIILFISDFIHSLLILMHIRFCTFLTGIGSFSNSAEYLLLQSSSVSDTDVECQYVGVMRMDSVLSAYCIKIFLPENQETFSQ
jgi:hypothetical protein